MVAADVPSWYPNWAKELAALYFSGTTSLFILHGNVHDLIRFPTENGDHYGNLAQFLASEIFGSWDVVLQHDLAEGLRPQAGEDADRLRTMAGWLAENIGEPRSWPREPEAVLALLDKFIDDVLMAVDQKRKKVAMIFDYAQYLMPASDLTTLAQGQSSTLVRFLGWAQNPYIKRVNMAFCLVADKLAEINDRLIQSPHVAAIEIPMPDAGEREHYCKWSFSQAKNAAKNSGSAAQLAKLSNGLTLVSLRVLLAQQKSGRDRADHFRTLKKTLIERQCQGLLEFIEPQHTLDLVVGHEAAKAQLRRDAELLQQGHLDAAPMGYLLCGAVGTGKTFLAECYAGSIGIPCVKLRNFRSKYVGETEGNLERVLTVLRALGPVIVVIDEADAALGTRQAEGDSGTSSRVFSMIASQMGDTRYRGRILWMLLTSRPDLLPIDLKRQGRAEIHMPLFYPQDQAEIRKMFQVMARKNKIALSDKTIAAVKAGDHLSGADIESIVISAWRTALADKRKKLEKEDLKKAAQEFIPSAQGLEKEMQEIAAVLECTRLSFLPPDWRSKVRANDGRSKLQQRLAILRQLTTD